MKKIYKELFRTDLWKPEIWSKLKHAIRLYFYLIDRVTRNETKNKKCYGKVLSGSPIKTSKIVKEFGSSESTIKRYLRTLKSLNFIEVKRIPYGLIISIPDCAKFSSRAVKYDLSDRSNMTYPRVKNDLSNIRYSKDDTLKKDTQQNRVCITFLKSKKNFNFVPIETENYLSSLSKKYSQSRIEHYCREMPYNVNNPLAFLKYCLKENVVLDKIKQVDQVKKKRNDEAYNKRLKDIDLEKEVAFQGSKNKFPSFPDPRNFNYNN